MSATDLARAIADAVMYEGYVLYPYTASARKNRARWQFGVLVPPAFATRSGEPSRAQVDLVTQPSVSQRIELRLRFLHVQQRGVFAYVDGEFRPVDSLTVDGRDHITWDEALSQEVALTLDGGDARAETPISVPAARELEDIVDSTGTLRGRIVRERLALAGSLSLEVERIGDFRLEHVRIENRTGGDPPDREAALRGSFVAAHVIASAYHGAFVSVQDPPPEAAAAIGARSRSTFWPVLLDDGGARGQTSALALVAPIILYDYPELAPETAGDTFDGTEIDELLNLSVMTLSDDEKREARATDDRARAIVDRADSLSPEHYGRLHGALRYLRQAGGTSATTSGGSNGHGARNGIGDIEGDPPGAGHVVVDGVRIATGSHVVLHPKRRADVWDTFLEAKAATVRGVYEDAEGEMYVAVTVDDDPASEMHEWYGRSLFFYPEEVTPRGVAR